MLSKFFEKSEIVKTNPNFDDCKICHDKADGIHYGVRSCGSCKVHRNGQK